MSASPTTTSTNQTSHSTSEMPPHGSRRGGNVPEEMVLLGDAQSAGTGDRSGRDDQAPLAGNPSVRRQQDHDGNRRWVEQQDQNGDEAGVRIQALRVPPRRHLPCCRKDRHRATHSKCTEHFF